MTLISSNPTRVLIAGSNHLHSELLSSALRRRPEFDVFDCEMQASSIQNAMVQNSADIAILSADGDWGTVRAVHLAQPRVAKIVLLDHCDHDSVINAFRAGARGLFCFSRSSFRMLCKCIQCVHQGQIWVSNEEMEYLLEAVVQVPSLRLVNSSGRNLLTPREEQVVALVADGLSNRDVARELGLSEHTIKKYLFRIFDKIGVSSRVELVLYAVTQGAAQNAEWVPSPAD